MSIRDTKWILETYNDQIFKYDKGGFLLTKTDEFYAHDNASYGIGKYILKESGEGTGELIMSNLYMESGLYASNDALNIAIKNLWGTYKYDLEMGKLYLESESNKYVFKKEEMYNQLLQKYWGLSRYNDMMFNCCKGKRRFEIIFDEQNYYVDNCGNSYMGKYIQSHSNSPEGIMIFTGSNEEGQDRDIPKISGSYQYFLDVARMQLVLKNKTESFVFDVRS